MWGLMPQGRNKIQNPKEAEVQAAILQWLKLAGYSAWRVPMGPIPCHKGGQKTRWRPNPMAGFPDIMGICKNRPGRMFVIEVKAWKGRISEKQKLWLAHLEALGVITIVARDLSTVIELLPVRDIPWTK